MCCISVLESTLPRCKHAYADTQTLQKIRRVRWFTKRTHGLSVSHCVKWTFSKASHVCVAQQTHSHTIKSLAHLWAVWIYFVWRNWKRTSCMHTGEEMYSISMNKNIFNHRPAMPQTNVCLGMLHPGSRLQTLTDKSHTTHTWVIELAKQEILPLVLIAQWHF